MHANDVFLFFKNHFWHHHIKMIWKHQKNINLKQRKKIKKLIFSKTLLKHKNKQGRLATYHPKPNILTFKTFLTRFHKQPLGSEMTLESCFIDNGKPKYLVSHEHSLDLACLCILAILLDSSTWEDCTL
jgi:hypothetical protein